MIPGRASRLRVHGERADQALRYVVADAPVEEVVGGQAAIAATAAETTAGGWYALVAPRFADAMVNPVILGQGRSLFAGVGKTSLKLLKTQRFTSGNVLLYYQPIAN